MSEGGQELAGSLQQVIAADIRPRAAENDAAGRFPREGVDALGRAGLLGLTVPLDLGGLGKGPRDVAEVLAELAAADASLAMVYQMHLCGTACLAAAPRTPEVTSVLREIAAGDHLTTLAFSEAGSRSHFWAPVSQARLNGATLIDAEKSFVTSAGEADSYVVTTQRPGAETATDTTLYLVRAQDVGVTVGERWNGLGLRANASAPMAFQATHVARGLQLTADGGGFDAKLQVVLPTFNLGSAAVALGISRAALAATVEHLQTARFEHLDQTLAEALPNLRAYVARMQLMVSGLEARIDQCVAAMERPSDTTILRVLEVKAAGAETAQEVTRLAMRTCGGAAFAKRLGVERHFRDAQAAAVMAPTTDVLEEFIGKAVLGLPLF